MCCLVLSWFNLLQFWPQIEVAVFIHVAMPLSKKYRCSKSLFPIGPIIYGATVRHQLRHKASFPAAAWERKWSFCLTWSFPDISWFRHQGHLNPTLSAYTHKKICHGPNELYTLLILCSTVTLSGWVWVARFFSQNHARYT